MQKKEKKSPGSSRVDYSLAGVSLAGGLLLWAAMPPLAIGWLAWPALALWILPICWEKLPGRRPYLLLFGVGTLHWLLLIQWMRLPHWTASIGWVFASAYLASYLPLFIGLSRVAVHRWRFPLWLAAPIVWVGLEYARGYLVGGFSLHLLAHTQVDCLWLIQVADIGGAYLVSFLMVLVAAPFATLLDEKIKQREKKGGAAPLRKGWASLVGALVILLLALGYGKYRIDYQTKQKSIGPILKAALIQGSIDTVFGGGGASRDEIFDDYYRLTYEAVSKNEDLDLIIWPESMFCYPYYTWAEEPMPPKGLTEKEAIQIQRRRAEFEQLAFESVANARSIPMLIGVSRFHHDGESLLSYNSALVINREGIIEACYNKMHPVWFGETLPFGKQLPWLYRFTPMSSGLTPGKEPLLFENSGLKLSPSICFESTVPHLIRNQVVQLGQEGANPDVLVSVTNDGWFWGSSCLDAHFNCCIFRAIENRCPMLIAANTGFSGSIDGSGAVQAKGLRHAEDVVIASVRPDARQALYHTVGDYPAALCLFLCALFAGAGLKQWRKKRPPDDV